MISFESKILDSFLEEFMNFMDINIKVSLDFVIN
jgi:hypothetical protein